MLKSFFKELKESSLSFKSLRMESKLLFSSRIRSTAGLRSSKRLEKLLEIVESLVINSATCAFLSSL